MFMKKALVFAGLIAATSGVMLAEDLQEISVAIGAPDPVRVGQLLQSYKYTTGDLDQLVKYADEIVAYNAANFNKATAGVSSMVSLIVCSGLTAFTALLTAHARNPAQAAINGLSCGFLGLICIPWSCYNIYKFSKNVSNTSKSIKIAEMLHAARNRLPTN
jgi:hypothetical protein